MNSGLKTFANACLKMILDYLSIESPSIIALAKECVDYGAYKVNYESV